MITDVVGWASARNRWGDETGLDHLIVQKTGSATTTPACGTKTRVSGQVSKEPEGRRACQRCVAVFKRLRRAPFHLQLKKNSDEWDKMEAELAATRTPVAKFAIKVATRGLPKTKAQAVKWRAEIRKNLPPPVDTEIELWKKGNSPSGTNQIMRAMAKYAERTGIPRWTATYVLQLGWQNSRGDLSLR